MGTVENETNSFPLLTAACGGFISLEKLQLLIDLRPYLRDEPRAELDAFMAAGREMFAPVEPIAIEPIYTAADFLSGLFGTEVLLLAGDAAKAAIPPAADGEGR